ncbi:type II toxin-antitoxin system RelE/ParE family toxin [Salinisphaera sp.]|uniref:type II toxin-antitoxin system RelE/ParE family toxin n=1 Tax=Salinisphaera sp. TaxID=1914330 RepID=UPI0025F84C55|nr:type II toxin-antitoxin system RelE/ParE family toxin [Salinisphaera sp.]
MQIEFLRAARAEAREQAAYYQEIEAGLDECFIDELDRILALLSAYPAIGQRIAEDVRRLDLTGFPHAVVYRLEQGRLLILAISHHRRRPGYWRGRLSN